MDAVFAAMNDPSRRLLLDRLHERDGQTLGELCAHLPEMTRFGVMNHLRVLGEAGLITTRKVGRSKFHYLNPVPIQQVADRWIHKFSRATVARMATVARLSESSDQGGSAMEHETTAPVHVYTAVVKAPTAAVWNAIVDGDQTVQYFYRTRVESTWESGSEIRYTNPDGSVAADGTILSIEPGLSVEMTFIPRWDEALAAEGGCREVWRVIEMGPTLTSLVVELYDLLPDGRTLEDFREGLPVIVSGLKTLLETGEPLQVS